MKKCSEFKARINIEIINHIRKYIGKKKTIDKLSMLENTVFGKPIKSHAHKGNTYENEGRLMLNYSKIDQMEESLTEEAGIFLKKMKEEKKREREESRKHAMMMKEKQHSLEKNKKGIIKEGVTRTLNEENIDVNKGFREPSVCKSICSKRNTVEKCKGNVSEVKCTANTFKSFLNWRASSDTHNSDENNVAKIGRAHV